MNSADFKLLSSKPEGQELDLLRLVVEDGGWLNHDDERLAPYCDDASTLTKPDVFNRCHDMGWLVSRHDHDTSNSRVGITRDGRVAFYAAAPHKSVQDGG